MRRLILFAVFSIGCRTADSLSEQALRADRLLRQERYSEEIPVAENGLRAAERMGNLDLIWRFRLLRADGLIGRRELPEVLKALTSYGAPPPGARWEETTAHLLLIQAQASYNLGRIDEVKGLIAKARAAAVSANSPALLAEVNIRNGGFLARRGDFAGARQACQDALRTAVALHDSSLEARAAGNFGNALMNESRYDEAIPWFERAEKTALDIGAGDTAARNRGNIGYCYSRLGDYDNARIGYESARAHFLSVGNLFEVQLWSGNEASLLLDNGNTVDAAGQYKNALDLARRINNPVWASRWLLNLAATSIALEDWEGADRYNKEGLALNRAANDTLYEPLSFNRAAEIAKGRGRFAEAADLYHQALEGRSEDPTVALEAHTGLAGLYLRNGDPRKAEDEFRIAIVSIESRQAQLLKDEYKLSWLSSLISFYRQYADFLVAQGKPEQALEVAESSRSKVLASRGGSATDLRPRTTAEYRQLAKTTGATLLEYFFGVSNTYLWVITPDAIRCHTLPVRAAIRPLVDRYAAVTVTGRNPLEVATDTGVKLYDMLAAPARADAPHSDRFVILPDEDLYSLNFETLPDGDNTTRFLIESVNIRVAPSLSYLADNARMQRKSVGAKMLLIGDAGGSTMSQSFSSRAKKSIPSAPPSRANRPQSSQTRPPRRIPIATPTPPTSPLFTSPRTRP